MKIKNILIIANGARGSGPWLKALAKKHDYTLALDGGADSALTAGITPDLTLGDLDSVSPAAKKKLGDSRLLQIPRQDNTDLEKGLNFAAYLKPQKVTIANAAGGRIDFTLANLMCVFNYTKKLNIVFESEEWRIYPIEASRKFVCKKGSRVSLLPVGTCKGITLKNLKYPLNNTTLQPWQPAVSNIALKNNFEVKIEKGKLLAVITSQP